VGIVIRVQREDFDVGAELDRLSADRGSVGGLCAFVGLVRDMSGRRAISAIELEHYPSMTERALEQIEAEATERWPLDASIVIHRFGRLEPGERIVLVGTASAHRQAAFEACEFIVDWLKTKAPFWKREHTDAGTRWVDARASDSAALARWDREDAAGHGPSVRARGAPKKAAE
jgi:molybdopterin synthase catalytic subunit